MTIAILDESSIIVEGVRRVVAGIEAFENADNFPFYERIIGVWQRTGAEMAHELGGSVK